MKPTTIKGSIFFETCSYHLKQISVFFYWWIKLMCDMDLCISFPGHGAFEKTNQKGEAALVFTENWPPNICNWIYT